MIEIYNESQLHRTLKTFYAEQTDGKTEQKIDGKVCDIVTVSGEIIEIQTGNLGKLASKIAHLTQNHKLRIVYPLALEKYIETFDENGVLISMHKSPKKCSIYSIFRELTGIYPWLFSENFTLEVLEVTVTEKRVKTPEPVQLPNKSRRFRKNWYKTGKELRTMGTSRIFSNLSDYAALLPDTLPAEFSANDLAASGIGKDAALMIWVAQKLEIIEFTEKKGKSRYYRRKYPPLIEKLSGVISENELKKLILEDERAQYILLEEI
jgi:hypothetical protein